MSIVLPGARLTEEQVATYGRNGYIVHDQPVFPQATFDALKLHFDAKLAALPPDARPEGMDVPHFDDLKLFDWLFADEILDLVEPIIGPDIALFSSHFICKPRGDGRRVPWHEDSYYWKGMLDPMEVATVWLAIDPSTEQNGCMRVIPQTLHGYSDYEPVDLSKNVFATEIKRQHVDEARAVSIEGSNANTSSQRRCGYTMRYMSTRVRFDQENCGKWHCVFLARGQDRAGNVYADPKRVQREVIAHRAATGRRGH